MIQLYNWLSVGLSFFNDHCKMIAIDLSKQKGLDADPKAITQINFTGNQLRAEGAAFFSSLKKRKKPF